jgi:hypothetical protein
MFGYFQLLMQSVSSGRIRKLIPYSLRPKESTVVPAKKNNKRKRVVKNDKNKTRKEDVANDGTDRTHEIEDHEGRYALSTA